MASVHSQYAQYSQQPIMDMAASQQAITEMLIDAIKSHPVLYDKRHPQHKDHALTEDLWQKIGAALGMSGMACQKKFKNLRDTFKKNRNLIKNKIKSGAGSADIPSIKWRHFEAMMAIMEPVSPEPILCSNVSFGTTPETASTEGDENIKSYPRASPSTASRDWDTPAEDWDTQWRGPPDTSGPCNPAGPARSGIDRQDTDVESDTERLPRPPKTRKVTTARTGESSSEDVHLEVASACLKRLAEIKASIEQAEDLPHHYCMALASKLRSLSQGQQIDAMHEIDTIMYQKMKEALSSDRG